MRYTRFESARIIGARALQISMGAPPILIENESSVDPMTIAVWEFENAKIPLTIQRSMHAPD